MGSGFVVLAGIVLVWPLIAWLVATLGRFAPPDRWRPYAWSAGAAAMAALALLVAAGVRFETNGTTGAMVALGGQILAAACAGGAVVSGLCALALRAGTDR